MYENRIFMGIESSNKISFCGASSQVNNVEIIAKKYITQGNECLKRNDFDSAIIKFNIAKKHAQNPPEAFLGLGRAYKYKKDLDNAETNFKIYLEKQPDDVEIIVQLGEILKEKGQYYEACNQFEKALKINPNNDYARRQLLSTSNDILFIYSPQSGLYENRRYSRENMQHALELAVKALPKNYTNDMQDVKVGFDYTSELGGRSNIAQYEHKKRKITVTSDYIYASANLVASYLIHEFVHAKDNDPYTSICEEQDAYRAQAEFWVYNSNNIEDPEMDYVVSLYKQSAKTLNDRVKEIYTLRDPSINKTSPNHPKNRKTLNANSLTSSQNLKYSSIIA